MKLENFTFAAIALAILLVILLTGSAAVGQAQRDVAPGARPTGESGPARAAATPPAVAVTARPAPAQNSAAKPSQSNFDQPASRDRVLFRRPSFVDTVRSDNVPAVPGLGFDYVHLAAISRNSMNGRAAHFDRDGRRSEGVFTPIFFNTWPYLNDVYDPASRQVDQPQPQIIVIQQPAPVVEAQQVAASSTRDTSLTLTAAPAVVTPAVTEPARDVDEFVFVRTDGRVFFASAFSFIGPQLQYVSTEGIRRTLPVAELDKEATRAMNEARGTEIHLLDQ